MKKFLSCLLFISSTIVIAQTNSAKKLLDDVVAKTKSYQNIVIDFKYSIHNPKENINQENKGSVTMQGNKYNLSFLGMTKIFDGKKVYSIVPEDEEVTISNHDENDANAITPNKIFSFFQKGFTFKMDIVQTIKGKKIQYVKLIPTNVKDQRKEILIGIDTKNKQIYNLIETGKNGTRTTLTVSSFKVNQKLNPSIFTFNKAKYPNYYINKAD